MNAGQLFGRSIGFPPRVGADGRWAWSEGADNVRESIRIILMTEENERLMKRIEALEAARAGVQPPQIP